MRLRRVCIALSSILLGACYRVDSTPERLVVGFSTVSEAIALALPLAAFLFFAVVAIVLFTRPGPIWKLAGVVALVPGLTLLGCGGLVSPAILQDEVEVTATGCWQTTGLWFAPTRKGFELEGVEEIQIYSTELWIVRYGHGGELRLDPGDVWANNAEPIAERLRSHGLVVTIKAGR